MSDTGELLASEEVEFLLGQEPARDASPSEDSNEPAREVTMRGELDQINLTDIFQTLGLSKMEGLLCVSNPTEQREVYFRNGLIRCLTPFRTETLRLGQRLIRAGLLSPDELRSALLDQKQDPRPLGGILTERGAVSEHDIDDILANQIEEELYDLFTWTRGSFEFYRGEVTNPATKERLEKSPEFDSNGVLLEVARRADEWGRVFESIHSLEEIFRSPWDTMPEQLNDDQRAIMKAVDGRSNVRDLADSTLIGLFDCAMAVRDLVNMGVLAKVSLDQGLEAAAQLADDAAIKRAGVTVHAMLDRNEPMDYTQRERAAILLERCGESREASELLLQAARGANSIENALDLARRARALDRRSLDALRFTRELMAQDERTDNQDYAQVLTDLADGLADAGFGEEALFELDRLEALATDVPTARTRKARVLAKLGRTDDAVETLLTLVDHYRATREKEKLEQLYEQVLKIDYRRRDIAKALRALRETALARRMRVVMIGLGVIGLGFLAWLPVEGWLLDRKLDEVSARIDQLLSENQLGEATSAIHAAFVDIGEHDRLSALEARIQQAHTAIESSKAANLREQQKRLDREAKDLLADGQIIEALDTWFELTTIGMDRDQVEKLARKDLLQLEQHLERLGTALPDLLPEAPSIRQSSAEQESILRQLETDFDTRDHLLVLGIDQARKDARIESILARQYQPLIAQLDLVLRTYSEADRLKQAYIERRSNERVAAELTPLYHEALTHERDHEFRAALEAYETLSRNHPSDDEMKAHFVERVERYAGILRFLELIDSATNNGDFATAQGQLRALKSQYPRIPFDRLAQLPVRVQTTPTGADVYIDGELVGQSPISAAYSPEGDTEVRVELDGFHAEATTITGDSVGLVRSLLARKPDWSHSTAGTIDRPFVTDGQLAYITDRAGELIALDIAERRELWSYETGDLSGLISRPTLVEGDTVAFTSVDGTLRCLDRKKGKLLWSVEDIPAESGPIAIGSLLIVATLDGRLVALRTHDGSMRWTIPLPGPVAADLVSDGKMVFVVTSQGSAHGVRAKNGKEMWKTEVGRGVIAYPALTDDCLAIAADDGRVSVLNPETGHTLWSKELSLGLVQAPVISDSRLYVVETRSIHVFDRKTGRQQATFENDSEFHSDLAVIGGNLFAGDNAGRVHALDLNNLEPQFLLRASHRATAPVVELEDGTLLGAFGDRSLRVYIPRQ